MKKHYSVTKTIKLTPSTYVLHYENGDIMYYQTVLNTSHGGKPWADTELHRLDGPAVEKLNGTKEWWVDGKRHREDGPAVERQGTTEWWFEGKKHREDGPAIGWSNGCKEWWVKGNRHRLDGPAKIYVDGREEWYLKGRRAEAFLKLRMDLMK